MKWGSRNKEYSYLIYRNRNGINLGYVIFIYRPGFRWSRSGYANIITEINVKMAPVVEVNEV